MLWDPMKNSKKEKFDYTIAILFLRGITHAEDINFLHRVCFGTQWINFLINYWYFVEYSHSIVNRLAVIAMAIFKNSAFSVNSFSSLPEE